MGKKVVNGLITLLVSIFVVVFPIIVFKVIPLNEPFRLAILSGITISVLIGLLFRLNIGGLFYTAIVLSYNQQKQVIKSHPILLNILYGIMIINFVILLKYVLFMTFLTEPTVFWKVILFTIFMII
jgi:hypothetical protein